MPDYFIYVVDFPEWILSKEFIPDEKWAREFFAYDAMGAMRQHLKKSTAMIIEAEFMTPGHMTCYCFANKLTVITRPELMRFELKMIMAQLTPAFYGLFAPSSNGGYYNIVSELEMTSPKSARYSDGSRWEEVEIINGVARFRGMET